MGLYVVTGRQAGNLWEEHREVFHYKCSVLLLEVRSPIEDFLQEHEKIVHTFHVCAKLQLIYLHARETLMKTNWVWE